MRIYLYELSITFCSERLVASNIERLIRMRSDFDKKTVLTLLDVFGSCITDVFYNHLYDRAIAVHEKTSAGITECYRNAIKDYVNESSTARFYTVLLNSLHYYVRMSTIYNAISYPDCVTLYASLFVPQMYIASLTAEQKINILSMIIRTCVNEFANEIIHEHIGCIIDEHSDPVNVEVLQDAMLKIILKERDRSYDRFIKSQETISQSPPSKQVVKKVQPQAIAKLTDAFKKALTEKLALKKKNIQLTKKNSELVKQCIEIKNLLLTQIASQKEQNQLILALKEQLREQNNLKIDAPLPREKEIADDEDDIFSVQYIEN